MVRSRFLAALVVCACPALPIEARAQDVKTKEAGAAKPPASAKPAAPDKLRQAVDEALALLRSLGKDSDKAEHELRLPTPESFAMKISKDALAETLIALGRAQAKLGEKAAARATWQEASDRTLQVSSLFGEEDKVRLFVAMARARNEAGDRDEARFSLRQALQFARMDQAEDSPFPVPLAPGMEFESDPQYKKADSLRQIAKAQAEIGDPAGASENARAALEAADAIKDPNTKLQALIEMAADSPTDSAGSIWSRALDLALSEPEDFRRARSVTRVLRRRVEGKEVDAALKAVADRLKGDLRTYSLWAVADAIADADFPVDAKDMDQLVQLVEKADYDRNSKKIKVYKRLAEAFARLGDADRAYKLVGVPHPDNNVQDWDAKLARIHIMRAVARAQIAAKQLDAAKDTVQAALELTAGLVDEDAESFFPLVSLGSLLAQSGDLAGARRLAESLKRHAGMVDILTEVAVRENATGHRDEARATLKKIIEATRLVPNDMLWSAVGGDEPPGFNPRYQSLSELAKTQARVGEIDQALKTLAELGGPSNSFVNYTVGRTLLEVAGERMDADDLAAARKALEASLKANPRPNDEYRSFERICREMTERGAVEEVIAWAKSQGYPDARIHALRGLAEGGIAQAAPEQGETAKAAP
jgi:tetratricopeptide (TPR) repeat protein